MDQPIIGVMERCGAYGELAERGWLARLNGVEAFNEDYDAALALVQAPAVDAAVRPVTGNCIIDGTMPDAWLNGRATA